MRLAFGFSIMMHADIYVFDEVLSVGDHAFQQKCFEKIQSLSKAGAIALYVSHNLSELDRLANKYIWLENSEIKRFSSDSNILIEYIRPNFDSEGVNSMVNYEIMDALILASIAAKNGVNDKVPINNLDPILFSLSFKIENNLDSLFVALQVKDSFGSVLFSLTSAEEETTVDFSTGYVLFKTQLEGGFLNRGIYTCSLFCEVNTILYDVKDCITFRIEQSTKDTNFKLFSGSVRKKSSWLVSRL
jgi:ABC-type multidrug transport system ATPase subunit